MEYIASMNPICYIRRWWNRRKPPKPFVPGMTLAPGESAVLDCPFPDEIQEQLNELRLAGVPLTFEQGPTVQCADGEFRIEVAVKADGRLLAMNSQTEKFMMNPSKIVKFIEDNELGYVLGNATRSIIHSIISVENEKKLQHLKDARAFINVEIKKLSKEEKTK